MLDGRGFNNYLVEIGGEIRARGNGKSGIGWTVGLEDGPRDQAEDWTAVDLLDYSVATSGTYRQSKPNPNSSVPASHLLDPRNGRPIEHNLVAVNVLAPTARDADALATALMILGPEEGMRKAEEMNLIARFCSRKKPNATVVLNRVEKTFSRVRTIIIASDAKALCMIATRTSVKTALLCKT